MSKPSEPLLKALKIIATFERDDFYHELLAKQFALLMWPDSPCWSRVYNVRHGSTAGKGMWLCAGSYLNKLRIKGLVYRRMDDYYRWIYGITQEGYKLLKEEKIGMQ